MRSFTAILKTCDGIQEKLLKHNKKLWKKQGSKGVYRHPKQFLKSAEFVTAMINSGQMNMKPSAITEALRNCLHLCSFLVAMVRDSEILTKYKQNEHHRSPQTEE